LKTLKLLSVILLFSLSAFGQDPNVCCDFFKFTGISGEVKLSGFYREQEIKRSSINDNAQSWMISGGILLNANSYFCSPNFLEVDLSLEYAPEQTSDTYLTIPDQGEVRTLSKVDLRTTLLKKKLITLTSFANYAQTYSNREFLSNIRTDATNWGGVLFFKSNFLPTSISYREGKMIQDEINTSRLFTYENRDLEARFQKTFSTFDRNELVLSHNEYKRTEREFQPIKNTINELLLNNDIHFDKKENYRFHSTINTADQVGYDSLQRFQAVESIRFKLPGNLELLGNYNYYKIDRRTQTITQQTYRGMLRHKLFESLYSDVFYEFNDTKQTAFTQKDTRTGFDLDYNKKIPGGYLNLAYRYLWQHQDNKGEASALQIMHEEYILTNGSITLLKRPYVNISSIQVWDATGTTLYLLNVDYLLNPVGNFVQIQRTPGGQIANNSAVYLNYIADVPGSYQFDMKNEYYSAGITMFKKLFGLYYRHQKQDYFNLVTADAVTLNYYTQQIYGLRMEYKVFSGGIEFDDNNSSILPYKLTRYYVNMQGQYRNKWMYSLNGNVSDYLLVDENLKQQYADVSGQLGYNLTARSKLNFDAGYRQQVGRGIDLELLNARLEYSITANSYFFTVGVQTYRKDYLGDIDNYKGGYFRISRRF